MPRNGARKQDRSTLYGAFAIIAMLPTAFSVAFEYSARGVSSAAPWLMALFPFVLLVAARFLPPAWTRSRLAAWGLVAVAVAAGAVFCWHLSGLLSFLGVAGVMRFVAPVVIAVMYGAFGALMGHIRNRTSTSSYGYDNGLHRNGSTRTVAARERVRQ